MVPNSKPMQSCQGDRMSMKSPDSQNNLMGIDCIDVR